MKRKSLQHRTGTEWQLRNRSRKQQPEASESSSSMCSYSGWLLFCNEEPSWNSNPKTPKLEIHYSTEYKYIRSPLKENTYLEVVILARGNWISEHKQAGLPGASFLPLTECKCRHKPCWKINVVFFDNVSCVIATSLSVFWICVLKGLGFVHDSGSNSRIIITAYYIYLLNGFLNVYESKYIVLLC